jgi:hypothetical protein
MTEEKSPEIPEKKDEMLAQLERMMESMPENSRQPILNLIKKRKVELGLMASDLPPAGYLLKKPRKKAEPKQVPKETQNALRKIAQSVGKIKETKGIVSQDIDVKEEPLKKDKKIQEDANSYKY